MRAAHSRQRPTLTASRLSIMQNSPAGLMELVLQGGMGHGTIGHGRCLGMLS